MEEAAQTLRANRWQTFWTVTLPLMRPGLANAFLLCFIESMADFGNPLVLGGNFDVLSTEIFFAIVGAQNDQALAAILAVVLLAFTLSAFYAQRIWLGSKSYTTVAGKGDAGVHPPLPHGLRIAIYCARRNLAGVHDPRLCDDCLRQLRAALGRRFLADLAPLRAGIRRRLERIRNTLEGFGVGFVLDDADDIADLGAADRRHRPADSLAAGPPELRRQERLRVRHNAELCHPRHGDRRILRHRLQCAADRIDRHRGDPRAVLHLPQHAGRRTRRRRIDVADRPQPR